MSHGIRTPHHVAHHTSCVTLHTHHATRQKSCGFNNVGIWLSDHLFAHGHLYLALSRLHVKEDGVFNLLFASRNNFMLDARGVFAMNTVYDDVLAAYKR